jgi:PEP-CTERM motif
LEFLALFVLKFSRRKLPNFPDWASETIKIGDPMRLALKTLAFALLASSCMILSATTLLSFNDNNGLVTTFNSTTVGTSDPTMGNCIPFLCNVAGQVATIDYQQVYLGSSVGSQSISSVEFYNNLNFGGSTLVIGGSYSLYLSTTSAAVGGLSTNLASNRGGDWTLVGGFTAGTDTNPMITISVSPFSFNAGNGNLLLEIIGSGQANVCNGCGNGYMEVDPSGTVTSRAGEYTSGAVPEPGTLVMFGSGILGLAGMLRRKINL